MKRSSAALYWCVDSDDVLRRGWRLIGRAIRGEPRVFAISVAGSVLFSVITIGTAYVLGEVLARVVEPAFDRDEAEIVALAVAGAVIVGVALVKIVGVLGRRLAGGVMQYRLFAAYRQRIARTFLSLPPSWHRSRPTGELLSVANADVEAAWGIVAPLPFAVGTAVLVVVSLVALFLTDPVFALFGALLFPAIFGLNYAYSRALAPRVRLAQRLRAAVSGVAHESFDGALVIKALGRESDETRRFRNAAEQLRDAQIRVGRLRGLFDPLMDALPTVTAIAALWVGVYQVQSGALTVAELVSVAYLLTIIAFPLRAVGWILGDLPRSVAGWERVEAVLAAGEQERTLRAPDHGVQLAEQHSPATLELRDVSASYDPSGEPAVLRDVSLQVPPGRVMALVGATGSGKSTLMAMLAGLLEPSHGSVLVDGVPLSDVATPSAHIAWVGQSAFLFDDTVRRNVTLGMDYSDDEVLAALRLVRADGFVAELPDGLDTELGERGFSLSGGQRQRLALARGVIRQPRLLLLDDATSSVDPPIEQQILRGLSTLETTVLIVAYRKASIALADAVAYLEGGRIVAQGTHQQLLASAPGYAGVVAAYDGNGAVEPGADGRARHPEALV